MYATLARPLLKTLLLPPVVLNASLLRPVVCVRTRDVQTGRLCGAHSGIARTVKSPGRKIQACAISPSNQELAAMTSILSSDLETGFRDRIEYSPELDQLMRKARKASNFLKALSHENRLLLLCLLAERERSVTELETILSLRQSAVSQQLARLRYDGMVDTRRDGKTIYYSLANEDVRRMISVVYDIFCATAEKR
jgi:DNA-binding transcriptional ArsR family regulator